MSSSAMRDEMNRDEMNRLTDEANLNWQRECYGCTQAELIANIKYLARFTSSADMLVGSMLSDVQEILERMGNDSESSNRYREMARQILNRAKFIIFNPETVKTFFEESRCLTVNTTGV